MALEADCGVATVLEALRVTTAVGALVPGECLATNYLTASGGPCDEALHDSVTPTVGSRLGIHVGDGKFEIRNSKFEIRAGIPNS